MTASVDNFSNLADTPVSPARDAFAIVPSDTDALARLPKAIFVGTSGTIALRAVDSIADVSLEVVAGQILPLRASHVRATGTSASGLVALA